MVKLQKEKHKIVQTVSAFIISLINSSVQY